MDWEEANRKQAKYLVFKTAKVLWWWFMTCSKALQEGSWLCNKHRRVGPTRMGTTEVPGCLHWLWERRRRRRRHHPACPVPWATSAPLRGNGSWWEAAQQWGWCSPSCHGSGGTSGDVVGQAVGKHLSQRPRLGLQPGGAEDVNPTFFCHGGAGHNCPHGTSSPGATCPKTTSQPPAPGTSDPPDLTEGRLGDRRGWPATLDESWRRQNTVLWKTELPVLSTCLCSDVNCSLSGKCLWYLAGSSQTLEHPHLVFTLILSSASFRDNFLSIVSLLVPRELTFAGNLGSGYSRQSWQGYSRLLYLCLPCMTVSCRWLYSWSCSLLRNDWFADSQRATGRSNVFLAYMIYVVVRGHWINECNFKLPYVLMWQDATRKSHWKEEEMQHNTRRK